MILLISLILVSCGSSGKDSEKEGNTSEKPESSKKSDSEKGAKGSEGGASNSEEKEQEEEHEYISEAKKVSIDAIEAAKIDISHVVFLDTSRISITCPRDIGEQRALIYDLEMEQVIKLPDNVQVIKKLENDDLFAKSGVKSEYIIIDGVSYGIKKTISISEKIDLGIDISPDGTLLTYVTDEGLNVSDLDFQNQGLLVAASKGKSIFETEIARYPRWLDSSRIAYKTVSLEGAPSCGVVTRDGTSNKVFTEAEDATIYPLISGDFIARFDNGKGVALIDANTGGKKYITEALLEGEGFSFDKNGKWVSYFQLNKENSKKKEESGSDSEGSEGGKSGGGGEGQESKWTAKFEVVGITNEKKLYEFETEKPNAKPIEDTVASPDGKLLLFTDMDKTGRRVLYKIEIETETGDG